MENLRFYRATPAEREQALAVAKAADPDDYLSYVYDEWVKQEPGGIFLAAGPDGPVSVVGMLFSTPEEAYLRAMRVRPEAQGRGLGGQVTGLIIEESRRLGARRLWLLSHGDNQRAHRLVERMGFDRYCRWQVCYDLPQVPGQGAAVSAGTRAAVSADLPALRRYLSDQQPGVISLPQDPWAFRSWGDPAESTRGWEWLISEAQGELTGALALVRWEDGPEARGIAIAHLSGPLEHRQALLRQAEGIREAWGGTATLSLPEGALPEQALAAVSPENFFDGYVFHMELE